MTEACEIAIVGSGFAGSLMARVLAVLGYDVVLLERGTHPRFAIGESTTPLANLSLERLARRYDLADCRELAAHGRWLEHRSELRRGLKRGFSFYRHHPGRSPDADALAAERLLVAASPNDMVADTHWFRADVDHHFVRAAVSAGVDYRDRTELSQAVISDRAVTLAGSRNGAPFRLSARFVIDASGPGGFLARQLSLRSALRRTHTRSGVLFSHFTGVRMMDDVVPGMADGPYAEDWAAVHHLIDEGWMYSLRFDHGVTSAGFVLSAGVPGGSPDEMWKSLLARYPAIGALFERARPVFPLAFRPRIQHRLSRSAGRRWVLMPHAYAFVDPLFSTGIAWSLRAVERLASSFERAGNRRRIPGAEALARYDELLGAEADQIDRVVAGAYEAMAHFELFAAHAMLYFAAVSFSEVRQRLALRDTDDAAWTGFLGVGDPVLEPLPRASLQRLRRITKHRKLTGTTAERRDYARWVREAIAPRNIGGFGEPSRRNLYPVDLDALMASHQLLGMTSDQVTAALPLLRGTI